MSSGGAEEIGGGSELAESIIDALRPAINELDRKVNQTKESQEHLGGLISELADLLHNINDDEPYGMDSYARKLDDSQKRVIRVAKLLENLTERLGNLRRGVERETYAKKQILEGPPPIPPNR